MKHVMILVVMVLAAGLVWVVRGQVPPPAVIEKAPGAVRFLAMDLVVDTGERELGSYQVELKALAGAKFVGLEGGAGVFGEAPFYDPAALAGSGAGENRLVVAAFSTAAPRELPKGKVRVARVHVMFEGEGVPELEKKIVVVTDGAGASVGGAGVSLVAYEGDAK